MNKDVWASVCLNSLDSVRSKLSKIDRVDKTVWKCRSRITFSKFKDGSLLVCDQLKRIHEGRALIVSISGTNQELGLEDKQPSIGRNLLRQPHGHLRRRLADPAGEPAHFQVLVHFDLLVDDLNAIDESGHDHNRRQSVPIDVHILALVVQIGYVNCHGIEIFQEPAKPHGLLKVGVAVLKLWLIAQRYNGLRKAVGHARFAQLGLIFDGHEQRPIDRGLTIRHLVVDEFHHILSD